MSDYTPSTPTTVSGIRNELNKIATAIATCVQKDKTSSNQMKTDLDLNGFNILNAKISGVDVEELYTNVTAYIDELDEELANIETSVNNAAASASAADLSAQAAAASASSASSAVASLEQLANIPVIIWTEGEYATSATQRYLFDGIIYICPTASSSNSVLLGSTPVGDSNWIEYSPVTYSFVIEKSIASDTIMLSIGAAFSTVAAVFVNGVLQKTTSYSVDTENYTVTFTEYLHSGDFVRILFGTDYNLILEDWDTIIGNYQSVGFVTTYTYTLTTASNIVRPSVAFTTAMISVDGVMQIEGDSYTIETDSTNSAYNQFNFSETLPIGTRIHGTVRNAS